MVSRFGNTRAQLARQSCAEASATRVAHLNPQPVEAGTRTLTDQLDIERQQLSTAIAVVQTLGASSAERRRASRS